jgi:predicted phosphodiesterase
MHRKREMRYLILSDIHGNLAAFEAVLADAGDFDMVWCLGDVIGYGPQPDQCIERLKALPYVCVAGNHDLAAINKLDISAFNPDALRACLWTREQLTPDSWEFVEHLPEKLLRHDFTLVHGSPRHPVWEYVSHEAVAAANVPHFDTTHCLVGHTHVPVIYRATGSPATCDACASPLNEAMALTGERLLINPGAVGQPRDGDPRASYIILDNEKNVIEYRRVAYEVEETQHLMFSLGLPQRLAARLSVGW